MFSRGIFSDICASSAHLNHTPDLQFPSSALPENVGTAVSPIKVPPARTRPNSEQLVKTDPPRPTLIFATFPLPCQCSPAPPWPHKFVSLTCSPPLRPPPQSLIPHWDDPDPPPPPSLRRGPCFFKSSSALAPPHLSLVPPSSQKVFSSESLSHPSFPVRFRPWRTLSFPKIPFRFCTHPPLRSSQTRSPLPPLTVILDSSPKPTTPSKGAEPCASVLRGRPILFLPHFFKVNLSTRFSPIFNMVSQFLVLCKAPPC